MNSTTHLWSNFFTMGLGFLQTSLSYWLFGLFLGQGLTYIFGVSVGPVSTIRYAVFTLMAVFLLSAWFIGKSFRLPGFIKFSPRIVDFLPFYFGPLGCAWILCHAAVDPQLHSGEPVRVVLVESFSFFNRPALVETRAGVRLQVYTSAQVGSEGVISCRGRDLSERCYFLSRNDFGSQIHDSHLSDLVTDMRSLLSKRINNYPREVSRWLDAFILGNLASFSPQEIQAFQIAGLFHLLVIGGFHIFLICYVLRAFGFVAIVIPYALKLINPKRFVTALNLVDICLLCVSFFFVLSIGANPASQRAWMQFSYLTLAGVFYPRLHLALVLLVGAVTQSILFPLGFFTAGNVMSWAGSLALRRESGRVGITVGVIFIMLNFLLFDQWTPAALVLNIFFGELFSLMTFLAIMSIQFGAGSSSGLFIGGLLGGICTQLLMFVESVADLTFGQSSILMSHPLLDLLAKMSCAFVLIGFFLNLFLEAKRSESK